MPVTAEVLLHISSLTGPHGQQNCKSDSRDIVGFFLELILKVTSELLEVAELTCLFVCFLIKKNVGLISFLLY